MSFIVMLNRTEPDFRGLSPFGSVTDRRTGPDFWRTVRLGAKRPKTDRTGPPLLGRGPAVRSVRREYGTIKLANWSNTQ
jgi:hypothetical protein